MERPLNGVLGVYEMPDSLDDKLIVAIQEVARMNAQMARLSEDLKETALIVRGLVNQINRIEAQSIDKRIDNQETRIQALERDQARREGGKESGSNIWKYSTGILGIAFTLALILLGYIRFFKGQ